VFGGAWAYVGHESEVPETGNYVRRVLGRRPLLLTRASDGELKNVPVPTSYRDVRSGKFDLGRAAVASYRGFVFGSLAAEPPDLLDWLGPARGWLDEYIDRYPGGRIQVHRTALRYEFAANWKVSWDNAADGIHATFAHRSYNLLGQTADTATVLARNPVTAPIVSRTFPHGHSVVDQRPSITDGPWATMRPRPTSGALIASLTARGLGGRENLDLTTGSMVNLNLFPNLIFVGNQLMVVEPIAVDRTRLSVYLLSAPLAPEEVDLLRLCVDEDFISFGTPDDLEMFQRLQEGLALPEAEWIDTSRGAALDTDDPKTLGVITGDLATEAPIRGYLKEWTRLMTHSVPTRAAPGRPAGAAGVVTGRSRRPDGCRGRCVHEVSPPQTCACAAATDESVSERGRFHITNYGWSISSMIVQSAARRSDLIDSPTAAASSRACSIVRSLPP
jgi:phenylpropionate dioxygenase-like ring-hydroxylating dioxygenase large terminal subunit